MNLDDHLRILEPGYALQEDGESIRNLLEQVHNERIHDCHLRPPWRLYILPQPSEDASLCFRLAFAYSHALADGKSGLLFHSTFLEALSRVNDLPFDSKRTWELPATKTLLPPLENVTALPISWSFLLGPLLNEYLPSFLAQALGVSSSTPNGAWFGALLRPEKPPTSELVRTSIRVRLIPDSTLKRVLAACRTRNVRLTGLMVQLTARTLAMALRARGRDYRTFIAQTPIDLRRCLPMGQGCMANFVSALSETVIVAESQDRTSASESMQSLSNEDWDAAQHLTERLSQAANSLNDQPVALLKYLSNFRGWTLKNAAKPATASFSVSNLGVFDDGFDPPPMQSRWGVQDVTFSQSADATGSPFDINLVSTKFGSLAVVASWWPGMLGVNDEEKFMDVICSGIKNQLSGIV